MKKLTKIQAKRNRQFRESLTRRLTVLFNPFRNHNYTSYVNAQIRPHKVLLDSIWGKFENTNDAFDSVKGKTYRELGIENKINLRNYRTLEAKVKAQEEALSLEITKQSVGTMMYKVNQSRGVMNLLDINRLNWLGEVKEAFDNRFDTMIDKMCNSITPKKNFFRIDVEELSNSWSEFEVLITVEDTTFHARAIWVNGVSMVSHYRFITTTRK